MTIAQIFNGQDAIDVRAILNRIIDRENVFLDLNYSGSLANTTNDSANLTTQWNAAIAAGVKTVFFREGTVNLSGLSSALTAPEGRKIKVVFLGTQAILADYGSSGTYSYPESPRYLFDIWKRTVSSREPLLDIYFAPGTAIFGGGLVNTPAKYTGSDLSQWGAEIGLRLSGWLNGVDSRRSVYSWRQTPELVTESNAREVHTNVSVEFVGNGSLTDITVDSPTNINAGARIFFQATSNPVTGTWRNYEGIVKSIAGNVLTMAAPPPTGVKLVGPISTTTTGSVAAGLNIFPLTAVTGLFVGRAISITLDNGSFLDTIVTKISSLNVYTQKAVPSGRSASSGAAVQSLNKTSGASGSVARGVGATVEKLIAPAGLIDIIGGCHINWEHATIADSINHRMFDCPGSANVAFRTVDLGQVRQKGGQHFGASFGPANDYVEYYEESFKALSWRTDDFVHSDNPSGGALVLLGFQTAQIGPRFVSGSVALNDILLTLSADANAGQQYIEVTESLTALTPKIVTTNGSGVAQTVALAATQVSEATTTVNGAVSSGTALVVADASLFNVGDVLTYTEAGVLRGNWVQAKPGGNTLTLGAAIAGSISDGSTVTRKRSNNTTPSSVFDTVNSNRLRMWVDSPTLPQGEFTYHNIVWVDTNRNRVYFTTTLIGRIPAGRTVTKIDVNAMADNGDELFYSKCHMTDFGPLHSDGLNNYAGTETEKGGEPGKSPVNTNSNSGGQSVRRGGTIVAGSLFGPVDRLRRNVCVHVQQTCCTVGPYLTNYATQVFQIHNGTAQRDIHVFGTRAYNQFAAGNAAFSIQCPGGGHFRIEDNRVSFHPYTDGTRDPFTITHNNGNNLDGVQDFDVIQMLDNESDTTDVHNEAGLTGNFAHIFVTQANDEITSNVSVRHLEIDGYQGTSAFLSALKFHAAGRIDEVNLGPRYDISGFTRAKRDLIMLGAPGVTTLASRFTTATTQTQAAGDTSIAIAIGHSFNLPKGSHVIITLDVGTHSTWLRERTVADGVLKLVSPIPTGRSVANGATVTIRPMCQIGVAKQAAQRLGLWMEEIVTIASGVSSYSYDIAGKFPCYRHSPGGPRQHKCKLEFLSGDRDRVEVIINPPTVTANNTSQAGGSVAWAFKDPTTPASAKNLTQATLARVLIEEDAIFFNQ